jgi:hypothetical protein
MRTKVDVACAGDSEVTYQFVLESGDDSVQPMPEAPNPPADFLIKAMHIGVIDYAPRRESWFKRVFNKFFGRQHSGLL